MTFPWQVLERDPVYTYEVAYEQGNVIILRLIPNRSGMVLEDTVDLESSLAEARKALRRHPSRLDLRSSIAFQLLMLNRSDEAAEMVRGTLAQKVDAPALRNLLGWCLIGGGRYDEASVQFRQGALSAAPKLLGELRLGLSIAEKRLNTPKQKATAENLCNQALQRIGQSRFDLAWKLAEEATALDPDNVQTVALRGRLLMLFGRNDDAEPILEQATKGGDGESADRLLRLRWSRALLTDGPTEFEIGTTRYAVDTNDVDTFIELSRMEWEAGLPGRALAVLEKASTRFETSAALWIELAEVQLFYVLLDEAEVSLDRLNTLPAYIDQKRDRAARDTLADLRRVPDLD